MIIYVIMYAGNEPPWFEPVDTDNPPAWFRAEEYIIENGDAYRQEGTEE